MELMQQSSRNQHKDDGGQDSSFSKLLREKTSIAASMKSINDVIRCNRYMFLEIYVSMYI